VIVDYAIMKTGGKQYRVRPGDVLDVEKLPAEEGSYVEIGDVLAVSRDGDLTLGNPMVADASVLAQVRSQYKDDKILVFKYKRKVRYRRKKGHRQPYTRLYITSISHAGAEIGLPEWPGEPAFVEGPVDESAAVAVADDGPEEEPYEAVAEIDEATESEEEALVDEIEDGIPVEVSGDTLEESQEEPEDPAKEDEGESEESGDGAQRGGTT
jgi:large subunit ribosomal protein L21